MITKLKLRNFKNFRDAEMAFGPVSLLIGANATGKSNVRDALRFLHGVGRGYNLAEIIGEKYGEGGQPLWTGIRGGTREACFGGETEFGATVTLVDGRAGPGLLREEATQYDITVHCSQNGQGPRVVRESLYHGLLSSFMGFDSHPVEDAPGQEDPLHLRVRLERGDRHRKRGPVLVGMSSQPFLTQAMDLARRQNVVSKLKPWVDHLVDDLESIRFIDFSPESMRKPSIPGQMVLSDRGENLSSVLQAICEDPSLKQAMTAWLRELTPMDVVDFEFVPDAQGKVLVYLVEQGGGKISANSASDGTLRFLGMLAALLGPKPARFYFLEEIDNGIHPSRLALLMDLLESQSRSRGIQIVATTHSPQVLRLTRQENLKYATLAYRLRGSLEGRLKPLSEIPNLSEVIQGQDLARLHESSWLENTLEFVEGSPTSFIIEEEAPR